MILPTKKVGEDRALITLAAEVLLQLGEPKTVSRVWDEVKRGRGEEPSTSLVTYDWFVLSLDLLYALGAIDFHQGRLNRVSQ